MPRHQRFGMCRKQHKLHLHVLRDQEPQSFPLSTTFSCAWIRLELVLEIAIARDEDCTACHWIAAVDTTEDRQAQWRSLLRTSATVGQSGLKRKRRSRRIGQADEQVIQDPAG